MNEHLIKAQVKQAVGINNETSEGQCEKKKEKKK